MTDFDRELLNFRQGIEQCDSYKDLLRKELTISEYVILFLNELQGCINNPKLTKFVHDMSGVYKDIVNRAAALNKEKMDSIDNILNDLDLE